MKRDADICLLAAALYDLRILLAARDGGHQDGTVEAEAAAIAYALHNDALAVLEGRTFDPQEALARLASVDRRLHTNVVERLRFHLGGPLAPRAKERSVHEFSSSAKRFCELVEARAPCTEELALAMATLHLAALGLPEIEPEPDAPEPRDPPPLGVVELPLAVYWDVFDPLTTPPDAPVANSFHDDIAEVRDELRRGLDLFDRGFPAAAAWEWRFSFRTHWGEHLVGAQRALFLGTR